MLRDEKYKKRYIKGLKRKEFWFNSKYRHMKNTIKRILAESEVETGRSLEKILIAPEDFKKLSLEQIEYGLNLLVKRGEISEWIEEKNHESVEYLLTIPIENRSERRILDRLVLDDIEIKANSDHKSVKTNKKQTDNLPIEGQIEISAGSAEKSDELLDF